jgi:hypothetical protein
MKISKMNKKCLAALLLVLPAFLQAAVMVDFSSSQVTNADKLASSSGSYGLSTTTPIVAAGTTGYTGSSLYGGFSENVGSASSWYLNAGTGGARIRWNNDKGANGHNSSALVVFKQNEFLNGLDSGTVSMDAANDTVSYQFSFAGDVGPDATDRLSALSMRFVLQDDSGWHVSEAVNYASGFQTLEATEMTYFDYDPVTDITSTIGSVAESASFDDIQFAGFYIDATRGLNVAQGTNGGLRDFSIQAIPEPATLGLIAVFGGGILFIRRRFMI